MTATITEGTNRGGKLTLLGILLALPVTSSFSKLHKNFFVVGNDGWSAVVSD